MLAAKLPQDAASPSLSQAAVATDFFERTRIFQGRSDISLGDALARHAGGLSFKALGVTATVRNYTLENIVLDADSLILFRNGQAIPETAYFEPPDTARYLSDQLEPVWLPSNEDLIFGYNNAHWGYQHWLTQCLPAIDWSSRQKRTRAVRLILPALEPWQAELLALLGHGRVPRLTPQAGIRYRLPRVEYSEFLCGATSFAVCLSTLETARRIAHAVPSSSSYGNVLYIHEATPYYGSIRNESAVIDLLRTRGVTIVERDRLGTAERINLFRNADAVIGPLGQGLTDVLFCRPGALLWEWMPRHQQNASFNRLAQAAQVDYWGDLFETVAQPARPGEWEVDLGVVARRLTEFSNRLAHHSVSGQTNRSLVVTKSLGSRPINELMLAFESLGDNCEFGLVQRYGGAEPLGLLRFNGFHVPPEFRLQKLVAALENSFDGLGAPGTVTVFPHGVPGQRELIVRESVYEFWYHTGIAEGDVEPEEQTVRETTRLGFLRRKLMEDIRTGDKIWVWKSQATTHRDQIQPLLDVLRRLGPNTLLWVVEADSEHPAGTIEVLEPDLIKGTVSRFAPYEGVTDIDFASWFVVCWRADEVRHPGRAAPEPEDLCEAPRPRMTAMEILARSQPGTTAKPEVVTRSRMWGWLRGR
ncbi:MAG: glycosyltransferase 61 family protein [Rhodopila sp.]